MSIIVKAEVKEFLGIEETDDDDLIDDLITRKEAEEQNRIDRQLEAADYTEFYDGDNSDTLLLNNYPINTITSLWDDTSRDYATGDLIDPDDIFIYSVEGKIVLDGIHFAKGNQNIKIIFNAGYETVDMPPEVKGALIKIVSSEYLYAKGSIEAVESDAFPRPDKLKKMGQAELDLFKRDIL